MALTFEVLEALALPVTAAELARRLEVDAAHLQRELERLERRGYVVRIACDAAACGWCTLKAACGPGDADRWLRA